MAEAEATRLPTTVETHRGASLARVLGRGFALHLKMMTRSSFDGFLNVLWPLFFSTVAFFMFQAGAGRRGARLRVLRRGSDGHLVVDEHVGRLGDAAGALERDARAARVRPRPLRRRAPAGDRRDVDDRALQHGGDAAREPVRLRRRPALRAAGAPRRRTRRDGPLDRRARVPPRRLVRPLPHRLGTREPPRVSGLARRRLPRPDHDPAGLGAADLVGARAHLGRRRDPGGRLGRRAGTGDRRRVRPRRPVRRDRDRGARERPAQRAQGGTLTLA